MEYKIYSKKYKYRVYGMDIESEVEIKELIKVDTIDESNKINIFHGLISNDIKEKIEDKINRSYERDRIWFNVSHVGMFEITDGRNIKFETYDKYDPKLLKIYLMCSCLGYVMIQRGILAIHGGVISCDNNALIITGKRGAGKSTLITALRLKGYKFLADDIASIYFDKVPFVNYGFPYQKLCSDAMDRFGFNKEMYEFFKSGNTEKYNIDVIDDFLCSSIPIKVIVEISADKIQKPYLKEVKGYEKLSSIIRNIYRCEAIGALQKVYKLYLEHSILLAQNVKYYKLIRPLKGCDINEEINLIEEKCLRWRNEL